MDSRCFKFADYVPVPHYGAVVGAGGVGAGGAVGAMRAAAWHEGAGATTVMRSSRLCDGPDVLGGVPTGREAGFGMGTGWNGDAAFSSGTEHSFAGASAPVGGSVVTAIREREFCGLRASVSLCLRLSVRVLSILFWQNAGAHARAKSIRVSRIPVKSPGCFPSTWIVTPFLGIESVGND